MLPSPWSKAGYHRCCFVPFPLQRSAVRLLHDSTETQARGHSSNIQRLHRPCLHYKIHRKYSNGWLFNCSALLSIVIEKNDCKLADIGPAAEASCAAIFRYTDPTTTDGALEARHETSPDVRAGNGFVHVCPELDSFHWVCHAMYSVQEQVAHKI